MSIDHAHAAAARWLAATLVLAATGWAAPATLGTPTATGEAAGTYRNASGSFESQILYWTNVQRRAHGVRPLRAGSCVDRYAESWGATWPARRRSTTSASARSCRGCSERTGPGRTSPRAPSSARTHGGPVDALPRAPPEPAEPAPSPGSGSGRRTRPAGGSTPSRTSPADRVSPRVPGFGPYRGRMPRPRILRLAALAAVFAVLAAVGAGGGSTRLASSHLNQRRRRRQHDVPDERGEDLPLGQRAVVRRLHQPGQGDVVGQPARPGARPARHAHDQRDRDERHGGGEADRARSPLRAVGGARPGRSSTRRRHAVPRRLGAGADQRLPLRRAQHRARGLRPGHEHREHVRPQHPGRRVRLRPGRPDARARAVPHVRRRGHPRPRLVVRRHPRRDDRAPAGRA